MSSPALVIEILREAVKGGQTIEIDGLGVFRRSAKGAIRFAAQRRPRVFVAYVVEDLAWVRKLCESLKARGCEPWLDKQKLLPGQNWPRAIERAIDTSDVFVACFSARSISKRGQFQSELRYALDCAQRVPIDSVFLIPVRFERCSVPRRISDSVQYVDLFPDWEKGVRRLSSAIRKAVRRSGPVRARLVPVIPT